jgi:hypothetical protein
VEGPELRNSDVEDLIGFIEQGADEESHEEEICEFLADCGREHGSFTEGISTGKITDKESSDGLNLVRQEDLPGDAEVEEPVDLEDGSQESSLLHPSCFERGALITMRRYRKVLTQAEGNVEQSITIDHDREKVNSLQSDPMNSLTTSEPSDRSNIVLGIPEKLKG